MQSYSGWPRWLCRLFHRGSIRCIKAEHYFDTSYGDRSPSTQATFRCSECGRIETAVMYGVGFLTKERLNGEE